VPGREYFVLIRLSGQTEVAINKSWKLCDIEKVE
jgi:hypothetical protein